MGLEEAFDFVFTRSFNEQRRFSRGVKSLRAFEMWRYKGLDQVKIVDRELKHEEVDAWLETRGESEGEGRPVKAGLKLLSCEVPSNLVDHKPTPAEEELSVAVMRVLQKQGLTAGWDWGWDTHGVLAMPECASDQDPASSLPLRYRQCMRQMQLHWRYEPLHRTTVGLIAGVSLEEARSNDEFIKFFHHCSDLLGLAIFPCLPSLLFEVASTLHVKRNRAYREENLERSTGHTLLVQEKKEENEEYYDYIHAPNSGSKYGELSIEAAALVSSFASVRLRLTPVLQSIEEIRKLSQAWRAQSSTQVDDSALVIYQLDILDTWMDYLFEIVSSHNEGISTWILRAQNQLSVLYNLITQRDQRMNVQLAKDSRTLAIESKRDSASMKTLAAVTMIFLPGTFIASLFSIPVFDWRADASQNESVLQSRFWVYWAVTVPITIATMIIWYLWFKYSTSRHQLELSNIMQEYESDSTSSSSQSTSDKTPAASHESRRSTEAAVAAEKPSKLAVLSNLLPVRHRHAKQSGNTDLP